MITINANTPDLQQAISGLMPGEVHEIKVKVMVSENDGVSLTGEIEPGSLMPDSDEMEIPDEALNDEVEAAKEVSASSVPRAAINSMPSPGQPDPGQKKMPGAIYK